MVGSRSSARAIRYPLAPKLSAYFTNRDCRIRCANGVRVQGPFPVLDQAIGAVDPDQCDKGYMLPQCGLDLLRIHEKAAVTHHCQNFSRGIGELGSNSSRQGESHCGKPIGDEARIGLICRVESRHPHLERACIDRTTSDSPIAARISATSRCGLTG